MAGTPTVSACNIRRRESFIRKLEWCLSNNYSEKPYPPERTEQAKQLSKQLLALGLGMILIVPVAGVTSVGWTCLSLLVAGASVGAALDTLYIDQKCQARHDEVRAQKLRETEARLCLSLSEPKPGSRKVMMTKCGALNSFGFRGTCWELDEFMCLVIKKLIKNLRELDTSQSWDEYARDVRSVLVAYWDVCAELKKEFHSSIGFEGFKHIVQVHSKLPSGVTGNPVKTALERYLHKGFHEAFGMSQAAVNQAFSEIKRAFPPRHRVGEAIEEMKNQLTTSAHSLTPFEQFMRMGKELVWHYRIGTHTAQIDGPEAGAGVVTRVAPLKTNAQFLQEAYRVLMKLAGVAVSEGESLKEIFFPSEPVEDAMAGWGTAVSPAPSAPPDADDASFTRLPSSASVLMIDRAVQTDGVDQHP